MICQAMSLLATFPLAACRAGVGAGAACNGSRGTAGTEVRMSLSLQAPGRPRSPKLFSGIVFYPLGYRFSYYLGGNGLFCSFGSCSGLSIAAAAPTWVQNETEPGGGSGKPGLER